MSPRLSQGRKIIALYTHREQYDSIYFYYKIKSFSIFLKTTPKDPQNYPYIYSTNQKVYAIGGYSEGAKKNANWGLTQLEEGNPQGSKVITGTNDTPQDINKNILCTSVAKGGDDLTSNKSACTSQNPINVIVN